MNNPTRMGSTPSSTPNSQRNRKLDVVELELRRLGRACELDEDKPASCSIFYEAADRVQGVTRGGARSAPAPVLPEVQATPAASVAKPAQADAPALTVQPVEAVGPGTATSPKADAAPEVPDTTGSPLGSSYP